MRFFVGSDHAAIALRQKLVEHLRLRGHQVEEVGPCEGERVDYPDQAAVVAQSVARGAADRGVLVCGTGIGMSIAANKIPGIRAALVHDRTTAQMAAMHNDANVLCLGGRVLAEDLAIELVDIWLATGFEERHAPRLEKISQLETSG